MRAVLLALALAACAAHSPVGVLYGEVLSVSRQGATGASSQSNLRTAVLAEAQGYCVSQGRDFQMVELVEAKPPFILGNFPKAEVRFRCA